MLESGFSVSVCIRENLHVGAFHTPTLHCVISSSKHKEALAICTSACYVFFFQGRRVGGLPQYSFQVLSVPDQRKGFRVFACLRFNIRLSFAWGSE